MKITARWIGIVLAMVAMALAGGAYVIVTMSLPKLIVCAADSDVPLQNLCRYTLTHLRSGPEDIATLDQSLGLAFLVHAEDPRIRREEVLLFIRRGANINSQDAQGFTALHAAVALADEELVRLLVQNGARLDIRDKVADRTPGELASALAIQFPRAPYARIAAALRRDRG